MGDGRQDVRNVRIPIEESVVTYGSGYEIGPRLRKCSNIVHNWITSEGEVEFPFSTPEVPGDLDVTGIPLFPAAENPSGTGYWYGGKDLDGFGISDMYVAAVSTELNKREIYDLELGTALAQIGVSLGAGPVTTPWSFAFAGNISEPTTFITTGDAYFKAKIINTGGIRQVVLYLPTPFDPDNEPGFEDKPRVNYYHLNRLWLAYHSTISRRTLVYYSDPFDPDTLQGTNFLDIQDSCNVIFRTSGSDLDLSSTPHLFFGCESSIWLLDGDPNLGNASFRQLKKGLGIRSLRHNVEISGGDCFLATDGRIYFLPVGSFDPIPVSDAIRGEFSTNNENLYLGWRAPYLYVFDGNANTNWLSDFSDVPRRISWSGPHQNISDYNDVRGFISDHPFNPTKNFVVFRDLECITGRFVNQANIKVMQTGYIYEINSDVVFKRAKFKFQRTVSDQNFTLKITNHDGNMDTRDFIVSALPAASIDTIQHILVVLDPDVISVGKFFFLELAGSTLQNIRDWQVEYRVVPRKD